MVPDSGRVLLDLTLLGSFSFYHPALPGALAGPAPFFPALVKPSLAAIAPLAGNDLIGLRIIGYVLSLAIGLNPGLSVQ